MTDRGKTSDLTQIILLTLFLCSAVFGGWGYWLHTSAEKYRAATVRESQNLMNLKDLLNSAESKEVVLEHLRREESKKNSGKISTTIAEIIESMKNSSSKPEIKSQSNDADVTAGITKHSYAATFENRPLREQITFLAHIQSRAPHLGFEKVKLTNRAKNETEAESWELYLVLVNYSGETAAR
ncbi:MAG: hypothetical protein OSB09_00075 [Planctomycetota bacterium]|nr:hypothetical protein [Planctomycetota bacterium]